MEQFRFFLPVSWGYVIFCLMLGAVYAVLLYSKQHSWSKSLNYTLAAARFVLVSVIAFFLLNPLIKYANSIIEKPLVILALDNSSSVAATLPPDSLQKFNQRLEKVLTDLSDNEVNIAIHTLDGRSVPTDSLAALRYTHRSTDLHQMLSDVQNTYENRHVAGVVLVSDGIVNTGVSPVYQPYNFGIIAVGIGDTIPKTDISIRALYYNKVAYWGNKFPLKAEIQNVGFEGQTSAVRLKQNGKIIESKTVKFRSEPLEIDFLVTANAKGLQHIEVEVVPLSGEFSKQNNLAHAYIDVIDGKEKILLIAAAPHPDLKAIKSAIEQEENYELVLHIPNVTEFKEDRYDLVILHQVPDINGTADALVERFVNDKTTPIWFIAGNNSSINKLNSLNNVLKINGRAGQTDRVTAAFNTDFSKFIFEANRQSSLAKLPPLSVPYGDYALNGGSETILKQQVGALATDKPLLAINATQGKKQAILAGEGLWHWRLQEFADTKKHEATDELIKKLIQYLSAKEDKRKFRVYTLVNEVFESERVVFEAEVYNNIYEKIYNQKIDIKITSEAGKSYQYSFVTGENASRFEAESLPNGIYRYVATTLLNGKTEKSEGAFTVKAQQLETLRSTADFALLRELATQNGGAFFKANQLAQLAEYLQKNKPKSLIRADEQVLELIHLRWIFFALLALATIEWFLRKWRGAY